MYCPNCGLEATPGLSYCKRCGGSLTPLSVTAQEARTAIPAGSAWAIGVTNLFLVVGGLAVLFGMLVALAQSGLQPRAIVWLAALGALTIVGSVALSMRFWMHLLSLSTRGDRLSPTPLKSPAGINELGPARRGALFPEPAASVTEHTTRTLRASYREPPEKRSSPAARDVEPFCVGAGSKRH